MMDAKAVKKYLLSKPEAFEDYPFGPEVAVFKIKNKMFAALGEENGTGRVNLKCDPTEALMLRDIFASVIPGYHMNKKHWNTVILDGTVPENEIKRMIDHSFALVVKSLLKKERAHLELLYSTRELYGGVNIK